MSAFAPIVSILTAAYNAADFLSETISSVLRQTFSDFELIVVNDGSSDGTLGIARQFAERDRRVRVFSTPNRGQAAARNFAIERSRGEFLALLDADDLWFPDYLLEQLRVLHRYREASVVTANAINLGGVHDGRPIWPVTTGVRPLRLRTVIDEEDAVCIMSVFRRSVVDVIGGFDATFPRNEDYQFWLRALREGFIVLQHRRPLAWYRRRSGSLSSDEVRMLDGVIGILQWAQTWTQDRPDIGQAVETQLARFERTRLRAAAKAHLLRGEYSPAADRFAALSALDGGVFNSLVAAACRTAPGALVRAYRARSAVRRVAGAARA